MKLGTVSIKKVIAPHRIRQGACFRIRYTLGCSGGARDAVLALDVSCSIQGTRREAMKKAAEAAAGILLEAGVRVGILAFADEARVLCPLTRQEDALRRALDILPAGQKTNHAAAFRQADMMLADRSARRSVLLFTDGLTTAGGDAAPEAGNLRSRGVEIFCIGLAACDLFDRSALERWASEPAEAHVATVRREGALCEIFRALAGRICRPEAENIRFSDRFDPRFQLTTLGEPTLGTVSRGNSGFFWQIPALTGCENAVLEITLCHRGEDCGPLDPSLGACYQDSRGSCPRIPEPRVEVLCGEPDCPPPCPPGGSFPVCPCEGPVCVDAGALFPDGTGRLVQVNLTLKNICPGRPLALAVWLTERDSCDGEKQLGVKFLTVPAHSGPGCQDISIRCIPFLLPDPCLCRSRQLQVRAMAHYTTWGENCCPGC